MALAVHVFFDGATESAIRTVWRELAETGIAPYLYESGNRPHLTLAVLKDADIHEAERRLESLTAKVKPLPILFATWGLFPTDQASVFLSPVVTERLLDLHVLVNRTLGDIATFPSFDYYLPDHWVPHCSIGLELGPTRVGQVLEIGRHLSLPLRGLVTEIGMIEFRPVRDLFCFQLEERQAPSGRG